MKNDLQKFLSGAAPARPRQNKSNLEKFVRFQNSLGQIQVYFRQKCHAPTHALPRGHDSETAIRMQGTATRILSQKWPFKTVLNQEIRGGFGPSNQGLAKPQAGSKANSNRPTEMKGCEPRPAPENHGCVPNSEYRLPLQGCRN